MKLIFVYNADSGMLNTVKDIGHKLLSPQTYDCLLCSLTHGTFKENSEWKTFRENSAIPMEFLHRDEFEKRYRCQMEYPVILYDGEPLQVALSKQELAACGDLTQLIERVRRIEQEGQQ